MTLEDSDPNRIFVGQQQVLSAIHEASIPNPGEASESQLKPRQFALCGLGGVGKTEAAYEFSLRNKDKFDAIFWVSADEPAKLAQGFVDISLNLGLETAAKAINQAFSKALNTSLPVSTAKPASWLLIFDNADNLDLLHDYWPEGPGSILITSRDPLAKRLYSSSSSGLDLEPLNDVDGGALLLKFSGLDESSEDDATKIAQEISRSLAGWPLAIAQMAVIIRRQDLSLSEFRSIYEEDEHLWAFEKLSPEAKGLMKLMLFMDPDVIQESILFDAAVRMFAESSFNRPKFNEARAELSQSSLIRRDKRKTPLSDYQISVHRLVQDAIRSSMSDEDMVSIFETMVDLLWRAWPQSMSSPTKPSPLQHEATDTRYSVSRYPICVALYPHVLRLKRMWPLVSECSDDTRLRFAALLTDAAWYQHEKGRFRGFDGFFDLAQSIYEALPGDGSDSVLCSIHFCLGLIYTDTNEPKLALKHKEANLAMQRAICDSIGPDFVDTRLGNAYTEMGLALAEAGKLDEAIEAFEREMEIRKRIGTTSLVSRDANYAMALMLRGGLDKAEGVLLDSVKIWEASGSPVTLRIARFFQALGNLRNTQKRHDESYEYHQKALHFFIEAMGVRSYRAADLRHKCALHLIRLERYEEAIVTLNAALECWTLNADLFQPELARTTWVKAKLLEKLDEPLKASVAFKVAGRIRSKLVPGDGRNVRELQDEDFDSLLEYRSR
ncbi:tetratricopeptide repeat domain-containing protein [Podospora aff. communis PSN243]|uniref:Tetratricopeptide repeat domain-containing protein n=1 Tax=Podospora aff. communis PSN243 TaxID=3040156 RepID=A0AAV9G3Y2_9PEZI|nr:tetratricopeptide repeat domain-containing protein [Podospora aff. communis PSN243]